MRFTIWACLVTSCVTACAAAANPVTVTEKTLQIHTYVLGPADRNPAFANPLNFRTEPEDNPLFNPKVYPYPLQTDVTRKKTTCSYRAIILENAYIRVIILPELGGHVYAAHDKTNDNADFIYHNHVIKPSLVALRGAWMSGGIEWNFPTYGHTVNTFSPVQYKVIRGTDGSATCVVGTIEWVRRMRWAIAITLFPDRSYFRDRILLCNRTAEHHRAYYWTNAAVHAWDDTRVTFPPTDHTFAGRRRAPYPWPIRDGHDVSWYRNTPYAHDYFCGNPGDFHGAYHYEHDSGTVHTASRYASPGAKFWTWGTADSGRIWEELLTDRDGQYIELQAGRLLTQGDTWIFAPHMREQWDEYWYPIKNMGGLVKANEQIAVNCVPLDGKLHVALNATTDLADAQLTVVADGKTRLNQTISLSPTAAWQTDIPLASPATDFELSVLGNSGVPIIRYSNKQPVLPGPSLEPVVPAQPGESSAAQYLRGYQALKHWNAAQAARLFQGALDEDPHFTPALRELAILRYKSGLYASANQLLSKVLTLTEDDDKALYYSVLCRLQLGMTARTAEDLHDLTRRPEFAGVAHVTLAAFACKHADFTAAASELRAAIRANMGDSNARVMLAAVLRHQKQTKTAERHVAAVLQQDPLNCLAAVEHALLGNKSDLPTLGSEPQYYLETAIDYAAMNLVEDAQQVLVLCLQQPGMRPDPFVHFYLGSYASQLGQSAESKRHYERGVALAPDYVFPFRNESFAVLAAGLKQLPDAWKLHYYLGTLLVAKSRWREGLEQFDTAVQSSPSYAVLYANLATIQAKRLNQLDRARLSYEKAIRFDPSDYRYYLALDQLLAAQGKTADRGQVLAAAPTNVRDNFRVALAYAQWQHDSKNDLEALATLRGNTFLPWEGQTSVRHLYVTILHSLADQEMAHDGYARAIDYLNQVMQYPRNLCVGKPYDVDFSREYYELGVCSAKLNRVDDARRFWTKAAAGQDETWRQRAADRLQSLRTDTPPK